MKRKSSVCLLQILLIVIQFLMVEFSNRYSSVTEVKWYIWLFNIGTYLLIVFVIQIFTKKWWLANIISSGIFLIFSIVNYYVITYHGMPLSFQEFANFHTAMNVIQNYSLKITKRVGIILFCFIISVALCMILKKIEIPKKISNVKRCLVYVGIFIGGIVFFVWGYISDYGLKNKMTITWNWTDQYRECRVLPCFIESFVKGMTKIPQPKGYSKDKVEQIYNNVQELSAKGDQYPDIILILNETFYDLDVVTDMDTDVDYFHYINHLDKKITGYAVSPSIGGGTNSAEYELLTSNSLQMLGNITPFTTLNMDGVDSAVSYLKKLGYTTLATHPASGSNYSRITGYSGLGFDSTHFVEDYDSIESYYDRWYANDSCVYRNLERWYDMMPQSPRFLYALTYQNHGDWNQNDDSCDTVHTKRSYDTLDSTLNEYLTCISMSDEAFGNLVQYYQESDRPVIICMVGDHAPSFVDEVADKEFAGGEKELLERSTPFIIWSNMFDESEDIGTISMIYLFPTILEKAGVPVKQYYSYLLNLRDTVPVLSSYGVYYDAQNKEFSYDEETPYSEMISNYFILEYDRLYPLKGN